eukprot:gene12258-12396_t
MNLATLIADKPLLASLSREYELLKATNGSSEHGSNTGTRQSKEQEAAAPAEILRPLSDGQLAAGATKTGPNQLSAAQASSGHGYLSDLAGSVAAMGADSQGSLADAPSSTQLQAQLTASRQPTWVAAAKLQTALQASGVVPLLQATAERERRLAVAAALARQQLALEAPCSDSSKLQMPVVHADDFLQEHQRGHQAGLQQQMLHLTQQMAAQNQLLQATLQNQQDQLQKHEGLLSGHPAGGGGQQAAPQQLPKPVPVPTLQQQQQPLLVLPDAVKNSWLLKTVSSSQGEQSGHPSAKVKPGLLQALLQQQQGASASDAQQTAATQASGMDAPFSIHRKEPAHKSMLQLRLQHQQQRWLERRQRPQQQQEEEEPDTGDVSLLADQQRQRRRPEWQSEVFVPPPSHVLRRRGKAAEAWGVSSQPLPPADGVDEGWGMAAAAAKGLARMTSTEVQQNMQRGTAGGDGSAARHTAPAVDTGGLGSAADAAGAAEGQPSVMTSLLNALDKLEAEEAEIRSRWFGQNMAVQERAVAHGSRSPNSTGVLKASGSSLPRQPSPAHVPTVSPSQGSDLAVGQQSLQLLAEGPTEVISKAMLKSIKAGRRRFLRHQATVVDGYTELLGGCSSFGSASRMGADVSLGSTVRFDSGASSGGGLKVTGSRAVSDHQQGHGGADSRRHARLRLRPTAVVEAVADLLLDELLEQQAVELDGLCESICSQLIENELL